MVFHAHVDAGAARSCADSDACPVLVAADLDAGVRASGSCADMRTGTMFLAANVYACACAGRACTDLRASAMLVAFDVDACARTGRTGIHARAGSDAFLIHLHCGASLDAHVLCRSRQRCESDQRGSGDGDRRRTTWGLCWKHGYYSSSGGVMRA
ncbi:MAG TPA: hypothetical protein VEC57_10590 [Candidatus Limnocylindrales bacterium]|nr:hypothetical protein [Candidatus Limnocylindrales bacterium]